MIIVIISMDEDDGRADDDYLSVSGKHTSFFCIYWNFVLRSWILVESISFFVFFYPDPCLAHSVAEPVGRSGSRLRWDGPPPGSGSTVD